MADGLTITELLATAAVDATAGDVAFTFPANGQAFYITTPDDDVTMDLGAGTTQITLAKDDYLELLDKNLAGKVVRFDGAVSADVYIVTQLGARV